MTDVFDGAEEAPNPDARPTPAAPSTAGGLIRAARERQGLHIAALAAAIKVAPRKLDALENDRYSELPDATFTRALAQTVCRSLKIAPQPVLALLPAADATSLDHVAGSLNQPFRDRPGREDHGTMTIAAVRPLVWAGLALLLAATVIYWVPASLWQAWLPTASNASGTTAPVPAASAVVGLAAPAWPPAGPPASAVAGVGTVAAVDLSASAAAVSPSAVAAVSAVSAVVPSPAPVVAAVPVPAIAAAPLAAKPASAANAGLPAAPAQPVANAAALQALHALELRADAASWVDVRDGRGQPLLSRVVQRGETVAVEGRLPLRLTIGNAPATRLTFRGKPVDLAPVTRDSVARLELQ